MAKKKTTAVGKTAKPAKTPVPTRQKLQSEITSLHREVTSLKHGTASKKHKTTTSKKHKTKTGLALAPGDVACCAAQALAASLRLATGTAVHDEDMLALYWRTAGDPDEGAGILDTLRAAREYGLAGVRPAWSALGVRPADDPGSRVAVLQPEAHGCPPAEFGLVSLEAVGGHAGQHTVPGLGLAGQWGQRVIGAGDHAAPGAERLQIGAAQDLDLPDIPHLAALAPAEDRQPGVQVGGCGDLAGVHDLILDLDLPEGPHAVAVAPDGTWWSWGEPYSPQDFAGAVLTDAWAVSWS